MYSPNLLKLLRKKKIDSGDRVRVWKERNVYAGVIMPKPETGDPDAILLKLDNGYNIGIGMKFKIEKISGHAQPEKLRVQEMEFDPRKPTITILQTGGTLASRVDYRTGGVVPAFTPEELLALFPELKDVANIRTRLVRNIFSEEMNASHYQLLAKEVAKEIRAGADGIILGHGTDTMHYTSAALSFMLQNLPVPVILVGSQRSSDRGSSDAATNLLCAAKFIAKTDFSGVAICMHGEESDTKCLILPSTSTRKMHTSRRDAFRPINTVPIASIDYETGEIKFIQNYAKKDKKRPLVLKDALEPKVALIKTYPGITPVLLDALTQEKYRGVVLEGTGLGHAPVNEIDEFTNQNKKFFDAIRRFIRSGGVVVMTSQTIYGIVNMNVYSNGRDLLSIGVVPGYMTPETALVKLMWVLGQTTDVKRAKELIATNMAGEISNRNVSENYLV